MSEHIPHKQDITGRAGNVEGGVYPGSFDVRIRRVLWLMVVAAAPLIGVSSAPADAGVCDDLEIDAVSCSIEVAPVTRGVSRQVAPISRPVAEDAAAAIAPIDADADARLGKASAAGFAAAEDAVAATHVAVNVPVTDAGATAGRAYDRVRQMCGACTPGIVGPIGPIPVGPAGDVVFDTVYALIDTANGVLASRSDSADRLANRVCEACTPGIVVPIGPIPVGPAGDDGGTGTHG